MGTYVCMKNSVTNKDVEEWADFEGKWDEFLTLDEGVVNVEITPFGEEPETSYECDDRCWRPTDMVQYRRKLKEALPNCIERVDAFCDALEANENNGYWFSY